jgi:DNA mismatch endonuclease (patch repair protein)
VLFVHGCFWHQHEACKYSSIPTTRREFWEHKLGENIARDSYQIAALQELGWEVLVVWECELRHDPTKLACLYMEIVRDNSQ